MFDVAGRLIAPVASARFSAGEHRLEWNGRGSEGQVIANGLFFMKVRVGEKQLTRTIVLRH